MTKLLDQLLGLHGAVVYVLVGLIVFAEDALFVGFVLPGETAAILGGVAASRGNASLALMCVIVVLAAVVGDSVGYEIGARYGSRLLSLRVLRRRKDRVDAARATLARRGGPAVFGGRFVAFLRAFMPFLAGTSHMRYPRFLIYNAAGGLAWGVGSVLLGYLAGNSYAVIEKAFGRAAALTGAALVVVGFLGWIIRRRRRQRNRSLVPTKEPPVTSRLNPYISFAGDARQAMEYYHGVFGGTLTLRTFGEYGAPDSEHADRIMHGSLETDNGFTLMGADAPPGEEHRPGNNIAVSLSGDAGDELRGYWEKLSDGGTVSIPLEKQMWGDEFGACVDRFGVAWLVDIGQPQG